MSWCRHFLSTIPGSILPVSLKEQEGAAIYFFVMMHVFDEIKPGINESLITEEIVDLRQKYKRNPNIKLPDKKIEQTGKVQLNDIYTPIAGFWG